MNEAAMAVAAKPTARRSWGEIVFSARGAAVGYALAVLAVIIGWLLRGRLPIDAEAGVGYALGIIGGSLMLILLLYSLRKRVRWLRRLGATRYWFRGHMMLGILGPVLILYHCNFSLGSLNSRVALYCTLLVAGSGLIGRYLYAKIHQGLYGRKNSLRQLTQQLQQSSERIEHSTGLIRELRLRLVALAEEAMNPPEGLLHSFTHPIAMGIKTRWLRHRLYWIARKELTARSLVSPAIERHLERLLDVTAKFLDQHLVLVRQLAQFGFFERLFSWWHIVHVPFFLMMIVSGLLHVLAVHMY
ncbi:MAG: transcriptional regulator [Gammaproteobacteria bacterium]|nr:MAG: transcriptional regulator [Gammaproteobacteria bacterium]